MKVRPPGQDIAVEEMYDLRDPGPTPDDRLESNYRKRLVYKAMRCLSKVNCEIILLKDIQGLSLEEISRVQRWTPFLGQLGS
jgi:DNA-directed RNA polymerase specialized sigma24 family protein